MSLTAREIIEFLRAIEKSDKETRERVKKEAEAKILAKPMVELTPAEFLIRFRNGIEAYTDSLRISNGAALAEAIKANDDEYQYLLDHEITCEQASKLDVIVKKRVSLYRKQGYFDGVRASDVMVMGTLLKEKKS